MAETVDAALKALRRDQFYQDMAASESGLPGDASAAICAATKPDGRRVAVQPSPRPAKVHVVRFHARNLWALIGGEGVVPPAIVVLSAGGIISMALGSTVGYLIGGALLVLLTGLTRAPLMQRRDPLVTGLSTSL
jgi:hypothetical protein